MSRDIDKYYRNYKKSGFKIFTSLLTILMALMAWEYFQNNSAITAKVFEPFYDLNLVTAIFVFGFAFIIILLITKEGEK